jgi:hypothetical protein
MPALTHCLAVGSLLRPLDCAITDANINGTTLVPLEHLANKPIIWVAFGANPNPLGRLLIEKSAAHSRLTRKEGGRRGEQEQSDRPQRVRGDRRATAAPRRGNF